MKQEILKELQKIPVVGKSISADLFDIGINSLNDLKEADPEFLYDKLCIIRNAKIDRCVLYVFRCAVYFASNIKHDPEKLKWWNWKQNC